MSVEIVGYDPEPEVTVEAEHTPPTVCATILTGFRPDLLETMLTSSVETLKKCDKVIVLHNGGDVDTAKILDGCGIDHERMTHLGGMLPNGAATTACALAAKGSGCDVWFHLEDDWEVRSEAVAKLPEWFEAAAEIASNPSIGQVRLREAEHLGAIVQTPDGQYVADGSGASNRNWCDNRMVAWQAVPDAPFMASNAHLTFNPMMMRTELIGDGETEAPGQAIRGVFPAESERHAQARFYCRNLLVAQMLPGVYTHIGEGRHIGQH